MVSLALLTQYSFLITFIGMCAATLYFILERDSLAPEFRSTASIAACYVGIAAFNYYIMQKTVGLDGQWISVMNFQTEFRYIDWLITTPLMLIKFPVLLGADKNKPLIAILVVADIIMILTGYVAETMLNRGGQPMVAWAFYFVSCLAFLGVAGVLYTVVSKAQEDSLGPISDALSKMKLFIVFGWLIYPLGFAIALLAGGDTPKVVRELVYNFADLFNKVGFGLIALFAAKQIAKDRALKDQLSDI